MGPFVGLNGSNEALVALLPSRGYPPSKWGVLVLMTLSDGTLRWAELRHDLGVGLAERLLPLAEWITEHAEAIVARRPS